MIASFAFSDYFVRMLAILSPAKSLDFSRGPQPEDAGIQSDLAFKNPRLFTLDTLNDKLLVYNLAPDFKTLFSDSLEQAKLSERDSAGNLSGGERLGLVVLR